MMQKKLRPVFLLQWVGNLVLAFLAFAWLQIPDSHVWQFLFSMLTGAALILAFLCLHARTFQMMSPSASHAKWWVRLALLLAVIVAAFGLWQILNAGRSHEALYAGYWNSRLSPGIRAIFTYARLLWLQEFVYDLLQWLLIALLLPIAFAAGICGLGRDAWRSIVPVYKSIVYWLAVVVCGFAASWLTRSLLNWTPGKGVAGETFSLLLRLGLAYTLDVVLWCFVLALIARRFQSKASIVEA